VPGHHVGVRRAAGPARVDHLQGGHDDLANAVAGAWALAAGEQAGACSSSTSLPRARSGGRSSEPADDRRCNAPLRRVLHTAALAPGAISFWRAAARHCRTAQKPLGLAPWLPTSRAPPPTRSRTAW
jgi:hypothetical protein